MGSRISASGGWTRQSIVSRGPLHGGCDIDGARGVAGSGALHKRSLHREAAQCGGWDLAWGWGMAVEGEQGGQEHRGRDPGGDWEQHHYVAMETCEFPPAAEQVPGCPSATSQS